MKFLAKKKLIVFGTRKKKCKNCGGVTIFTGTLFQTIKIKNNDTKVSTKFSLCRLLRLRNMEHGGVILFFILFSGIFDK